MHKTDKVAYNRHGREIYIGGHQAICNSRVSSSKKKDAGREKERHAKSGAWIIQHQTDTWGSNESPKGEFLTWVGIRGRKSRAS